MNGNVYPTVIRSGNNVQRQKLSLSSRVNANTQKKIDRMGRTNDYHLQTTYHLVDIAQGFTRLNFKKEKISVKKKMISYQNQLEGYRRLQQNRGSANMQHQSTDIGAQSMTTLPEAEERNEVMKSLYNSDSMRSIRRRSRKPMLDNSSIRDHIELHRLQARHVTEYKQAMDEMQKLELKTGITFSLRVPRRSLSAYQASVEGAKHLSLIASMRNQIKATQSKLNKIQEKFRELSSRLERKSYERSTERGEARTECGENEEEQGVTDSKTFHIFCEESLDELKESPSEVSKGDHSTRKLVKFPDTETDKLSLPDVVDDRNNRQPCSHSASTTLREFSKSPVEVESDALQSRNLLKSREEMGRKLKNGCKGVPTKTSKILANISSQPALMEELDPVIPFLDV